MRQEFLAQNPLSSGLVQDARATQRQAEWGRSMLQSWGALATGRPGIRGLVQEAQHTQDPGLVLLALLGPLLDSCDDTTSHNSGAFRHKNLREGMASQMQAMLPISRPACL